MSLPLRLPYCSPARRLRAVLLFPYFRAPVTPPPSPACSQEPDSEPEGGTPESYTEDDAWLCAGSHWGPVLNGSVGAVPQSWAWSGPPNTPQAPQPRHRPPPTAVPASYAATSPGTMFWNPQSIRPPVLGRPRPSVAQSPRRAKERQPGTASAGGKEPELCVNSQNERRWRSMEGPTPGLPVPRTLSIRGVAGRGMSPVKRSGKLSKPASALPEKYQGRCRRVTLEFKGVEKPR
ncbi:translation initiation factor IF-2-like [Apodemus sylvaticus]|uniref:translation initiation factor IF-2-like n=1 Tax=Apodemus sylvaticus TaxID=10129 RepID=UPI002241BD22|nr:translation initiation factor IF-2-like [Apodemus sylvaticus]